MQWGQREGESQYLASWQLDPCEKCQMTLVPAKLEFPSCSGVFKMLIKILKHFHLYWLGLVLVKVLAAAITDNIWNFHGLTQRKCLRKSKTVRRHLLRGKGHGKERENVVFWSTQLFQGSTVTEAAISTCGTQGGLQCQRLLYPHRKKEKEVKRKKKSRRKKEEKAHLFFNCLGVKMTQITGIHIL